jgi:hypothetical protein
MADDGFKRKLTSIFSSDVEDYRRFMREVEDFTVWIFYSLL